MKNLIHTITFSKFSAFVAVCFLFITNFSFSADNPATSFSTESVYNLNSIWTNQDSKKVKISSYEGSTTLVVMIFTSCMKACPMLLEDAKKVEKLLSEKSRKKVKFAIFSFDVARDNPKVLKEYAKIRGLLKPEWTFYQGDEKSVKQLAAVLGVSYKIDEDGDFKHSSQLTVLDKKGIIRYQQNGYGKGAEETAKNLEKVALAE